MAEFIKLGAKVKYLYQGLWQKGVVHAVKTYEQPNGIIIRGTYLIDTGRTIREDIGANANTGKPETVRQPEQIEIDQESVRPI